MALVLVGNPRRRRWVGPPGAAAVERVRRDLRRVLARWRVCDDVIDDVMMWSSNCSTTSSGMPARTGFCVLLELDEQKVHVAVEDGLVGAAHPRTVRAGAAPFSGLRLVNAVALRWGWHERNAGKTVWAEFLA